MYQLIVKKMKEKVNGEGDCFYANAEWIIKHYPLIKNSKLIFLCHGMVIGAKDSKVEGLTFMHAWIEINEYVLDYSNGKEIMVPKEGLYSKGRILKNTVVRYSPDEVLGLLLKHNHYGPWKK